MRLSFKNLKIWQRGIGLVYFIYESTELFPKKELYGLISQMNRSASYALRFLREANRSSLIALHRPNNVRTC